MGLKLTPEFIQSELEVIGRLETAIKSEVGALRDEFRQAMQVVLAQLADANRRNERMADKIIEMAMVQRGQTQDAVTHRRASGMDAIPPAGNSTVDSPSMWGDPVDEDEWPPKGYDIIPTP